MFSIVIVAIIMFMSTGTRSYQYSRLELNLQKESQMLIAQVRDLAYNANYAEYDATHNALILDTVQYQPSTPVADPLATPIPGKSVITERNAVYLLDGKMYVEDCATTDPATGAVTISAPTYAGNNEDLLSNYVTAFTATTNKQDVQLKITMKNGRSKEYKVNEGITLRSGFRTPTP